MLSIAFDGSAIELVLTDAGTPAPPGLFERAPPPATEGPTYLQSLPESGRGLAIIHGCVDRVSYARRGPTNELRLAVRNRAAS